MSYFFISAATHYMMLHNRKDPAVFDGNYLLGSHWRASDAKKHYLREAVISLSAFFLENQTNSKFKNQFHEFFFFAYFFIFLFQFFFVKRQILEGKNGDRRKSRLNMKRN